MTTNYNIVYCGDTMRIWEVGDVFTLPNNPEIGWRVAPFIGLRIQSISYNHGQVLQFDMAEWEKARKHNRSN